jgi:hypothetical protein
MPLPSVTRWSAPQCTARAKHSRQRCLNPAAHGMPVCRNHGARRPETVKRGPDHPNFKIGEQTQDAKAARSAKLAELRDLEAAMFTLGVMQGKRWPGRKPKAA